MKNPSKVLDALPVLIHFKAFSYIIPNGAAFSPHLFRSDYVELKKACDKWIQSESAIYRTCCASLKLGNMLELDTEETSKNFSGRLLMTKIIAEGANFSDTAATGLVRNWIGNQMLPHETVSKFYHRHVGILKMLKSRGHSAEDILALVEKTVFSNGLPDETFGRMKDVIAFNEGHTITDILSQAKTVENLDGERFAAEHGASTAPGRINAAIGGKNIKACWSVLLNGSCKHGSSCQFSHDRRVIMQAALDMARGRITPPRSFGVGRGQHANLCFFRICGAPLPPPATAPCPSLCFFKSCPN